MDLIATIKSDPALKDFLSSKCVEKGVKLQIKTLEYITIKLDKYYESLRLDQPPASPDCLTILKCEAGGYKILITELKSGDIDDVTPKFKTALEDFVGKRFKSIFMPSTVLAMDIQLICVQNRKSRKASVRAKFLKPIKFGDTKLLMLQKLSPLIIEDCQPVLQ